MQTLSKREGVLFNKFWVINSDCKLKLTEMNSARLRYYKELNKDIIIKIL